MSNILKNQGRWFPVPREFVEGGHLRDLSGSAVTLYVFLLFLGQKHSAVELEVPDYEVRDYTGLHSETAARARLELKGAGLIDCKKGRTGVTTYILLAPKTCLRLPAPEGRTGIRKHHPRDGRSAKTIRKLRSRVTEKPGLTTASVHGKTVTPSRKNRDPVTEKPGPCVHNENKTRDLKDKLLSEYISEKGISEQGLEDSERSFDWKLNPKRFECFIHGKKVKFSGPFCVVCHPEIDERQAS